MEDEVIIKQPKLAPYQKKIVDSEKRFSITEGSTKCGKTFSHIWWLFRESHRNPNGEGHRYWWIAPVYQQAKIAFLRIKKKVKDNPFYTISEGSMEITNPYGAILSFKSSVNPDNLYGDDVYAAVIDEGSRMKEEAWHAVRSTLVATNGRAKLIGNVVGTDNWYYRLARKAEAGELPAWDYFRFTAADAIEAGIVSQEEVDEAKYVYPEEVFLELFYAIPFVNSANKFAFSFNASKHVGRTVYNPGQYLYLSFDFNRNPIMCTAFQHYNNTIYAIKCFKLMNSDIYRLCDLIRITYPTATFIVNGDATGKAGSALVRDNLNYYTVIKQKLRLSDAQLKIPGANPDIAENQLLVNAVLAHHKVVIDAVECQPLIYDLQFVEMLPDGSIRKGDRNDPKQQADALDTFRYYLNSNFKQFLRLRMNERAEREAAAAA